MYRVPLDAVAHEEVVVRSFQVVQPVQVRLKAALEPPGPAEGLCAVIIETDIIVPVSGAERHCVVVVPRRGKGVAGVAIVTADMQTIQISLALDPEVVILRPVILAIPVLHLDAQSVVA